MTRFIFTSFIFSFFISAQAFAGFEWVPPTQISAPLPQVTASPVENNAPSEFMGAGFPAPTVSSEPLANKSPVSILPTRQISQSTETKNLSGNKLIINPYPLRNKKEFARGQISMVEVYKAMNEESGKLHPVKLGNGMTTGAKHVSKPVPKAVRSASVAHKTFLTPTRSGITPMMGVEPAPLPGMAVAPRTIAQPVRNYTEAIGFGRDLPLALALSQVVPTEFTHSYAKNVDAGVSVSWEGGKSWNEVLNDMLRPNNLTAVIQDNQVIIQPMANL